ncbi:MAG TPA: phosphotransferase [Solirubrobacteraceae bacterium]|jgi:Ser/Thr protein kinase RdoA (MazF antagonist)|nr:phosphotransferase [Solirubrobacteraceae bacterium]
MTALAAHLAAQYGIEVAAVSALEKDVFRVDRRDGPSWVARVFAERRPLEGVHGDAAILRALEREGFPAERCAHPDPVSTHEGKGVLVTEFIPPAAPLRPGRPAAILGVLLGRLHAHPAKQLRRGGAWHHLSFEGGPREEIAAAAALLDDAAGHVGVGELALLDRLRDAVQRADACEDLPHAFVHPDFVPANAIPTPDEHLAIVDWTGAGRGPRLWSLGFLLWAAGARSLRLVDVAVSRYRRHVELTPGELDRLEGAIAARPIMLECWSVCAGRRELADAVERVADVRRLAPTIAARACQAFT